MADDWDDTAADGGTDLEVGLPKLTSFAIIGSFAILVCACLYIAGTFSFRWHLHCSFTLP